MLEHELTHRLPLVAEMNFSVVWSKQLLKQIFVEFEKGIEEGHCVEQTSPTWKEDCVKMLQLLAHLAIDGSMEESMALTS